MFNFFANIGIKPFTTILFFLLHIFLGILLRNSSEIATYYGILIFFIGILSIFIYKQSFVNCVVGYFVGLEVLLRMSAAKLFWEFGKYSVSGILILSMLVNRRKTKSTNISLFLYFLLLLPAIFWTPFESFNQFREELSFNLSGPFSLLICVLYFSKFELKKQDLQRIFCYTIAPIVGIASVALKGIKEAEEIIWGTSSLFVTSGYFGPNQVSSILGFGALLCIIAMFIFTKDKILRFTFIGLSIWFFIHAILTFSRGGVYNACIPLGIFLLFLLKGSREKVSALFLGIFLIITFQYYVIPKLNEFTKGALEARFTKKEKIGDVEILDTTGRINILLADLNVFMENILGVGVGQSKFYHKTFRGASVAPHSEWSRLLAEHGLFGLLSIYFLWLWVAKRYKHLEYNYLSKALAASFIAFFAFYLFHSAMRLVAPSFVLGLLGAEFNFEEKI